ncbi:glycine reductase [Treponema pedis]
MATITTISKSVGANRIVPTIAIPYPVGNPRLSAEEELEIRRALTQKAVKSLAAAVTGVTEFE